METNGTTFRTDETESVLVTDPTADLLRMDAAESTATVAAGAFIGMACILVGTDLLQKSIHRLKQRGVSVGTVAESLTMADRIVPEISAGETADDATIGQVE